ncbi:tripartite tricarboxylate transporter permease [Nonomuraea sp. NPDC049028]|uniref:tripartite tricarboxylate transporter permease n=1 Tax=Nonomuraea sp. NPDC049028 TaxID=3364348 RepID=UPI00371AC602
MGIGLLLASIGQDPMSGASRWAFGVPDLMGGIDIVAVIMGLFGLTEILVNIVENRRGVSTTNAVGRVLPTGRDLKENTGAIGRGSLIGTGLGLVPGGGGVLASLVSYGVERKISRTPERFGHPDIFWGVVGSMVVGNLILLVMNIPLLPVFVRIAKIPPAVMSTLTVAILIVGAYTINGNTFDVAVMVAAGLAGYLLRSIGVPPAPIVLAFILGPIFETNFRRSLVLSDGGFGIFASSPTAVVLLALTILVLISTALPLVRQRRRTLEAEN